MFVCLIQSFRCDGRMGVFRNRNLLGNMIQPRFSLLKGMPLLRLNSTTSPGFALSAAQVKECTPVQVSMKTHWSSRSQCSPQVINASTERGLILLHCWPRTQSQRSATRISTTTLSWKRMICLLIKAHTYRRAHTQTHKHVIPSMPYLVLYPVGLVSMSRL